MLNDFCFVVDSTPRRHVSLDTLIYNETNADLPGQVLIKAKEAFGEKARFICFTKSKSGSIRFFKKRGIAVTKKSGQYFLENDPKRMVVWATIDVPQDYYIKRMGGTPGAVDLSELDTEGVTET